LVWKTKNKEGLPFPASAGFPRKPGSRNGALRADPLPKPVSIFGSECVSVTVSLPLPNGDSGEGGFLPSSKNEHRDLSRIVILLERKNMEIVIIATTLVAALVAWGFAVKLVNDYVETVTIWD
jgi:hypothetical protein